MWITTHSSMEIHQHFESWSDIPEYSRESNGEITIEYLEKIEDNTLPKSTQTYLTTYVSDIPPVPQYPPEVLTESESESMGEKRSQDEKKRQETKRQRVLKNRTPSELPKSNNRTKFVKKGSKKTKGNTPPKKKPTTPRNWKLYNQGQYNEFEYFTRFAAELVDTIADSTKKNNGRPPIEYRDLVLCALIISHYGVSGRRARPFIKEAWVKGYITREPAPTTIWKFMDSKALTEVLKVLVMVSATPAVVAEVCLAVDSSGFRTSSYSDWFGEHHRYDKYNEWLKLHVISCVATHVIAKAIVTDKNTHDSPIFPELLDDVVKRFKIKEVYADKAYSARSHYTLCEKYGIRLFVPFKSNATGRMRGSRAWGDAFTYAITDPEDFYGHYHKRSNVETVFYMIKSTSGETLRSKKILTQTNELYCKVISHNIRMIIMYLTKEGWKDESAAVYP